MTRASPGRSFSIPYCRTVLGIILDMEARCTGWEKDWAMMRSLESNRAQEKSDRVLMLVE